MVAGTLRYLECSGCGKHLGIGPLNLCPSCHHPLLARYDLGAAAASPYLDRTDLWRYAPHLPASVDEAVTLGEGRTPLLRFPDLERGLGISRVYVKDEGLNPTGSFKARGMAVAVSMARALGLRRLAVPSAGNAGAALAAYAARAGMEAVVVVPRDVPPPALLATVEAGARVFMVDGLISDAGRLVGELCAAGDYFNMATMAEPYRVEGKKTMGLELAEALDPAPDWIVFPTGGGTGIIGLWKAYQELGASGRYRGRRPRLAVVQSTGCAPVVRAFHLGQPLEPWLGARTVAAGLRVPNPLASDLVLAALRESRGTAVAVPDGDIVRAVEEMSRTTGISPALEGAAAFAGLRELISREQIEKDETAVVFNTGSGLINPPGALGPAPAVPVVGHVEDLVRALEGATRPGGEAKQT